MGERQCCSGDDRHHHTIPAYFTDEPLALAQRFNDRLDFLEQSFDAYDRSLDAPVVRVASP